MEILWDFFFEESRAYEHKPKGGKNKLELQKKKLENIILMKTLYILMM